MKTGPVATALRKKILEQGIVPYGSRILVGVSGGADSTALLYVLYGLRHELALDLVVVHYDHSLRAGSGKDLHFVEKMAKDLGLVFLSEKNLIKCPKGCSIEDFARTRRFDFFGRMVKKTRADAVVLAHTQDDLAETVLMRILRGTGLSGLRSILPQRQIGGILFLRPFLGTTRLEVEAFLAEKAIRHIEDPTNQTDDFLRNRIRHKLIPYMAKEFSGTVKEKLVELALSASSDYDFIETSMTPVIRRLLKVRGKTARVSREAWIVCPQAVRRMVLREAIGRISPDKAMLTFSHVLLVERTAMGGKHARVSLPGGHEAVITDKLITLA